MFIQIFKKEWRENLVILGLSLLMMSGLAVLSATSMREMTSQFSGAFLLFFLPLAGVLIGSGGFYSEHKDSAWIYLFSRPIRREILWIFKFASLLSVLLVIFGIFTLFRQLLPSLDQMFSEYITPIRFIEGVPLYVLLPILMFCISFSLSVLYERQFIILFVSLAVGALLAFLIQAFFMFLYSFYWYYGGVDGLLVMIALSFCAASVLTLRKCDFSRTGRKIGLFTKYAVIFLLISFAFVTVWVGRGELFTGVHHLGLDAGTVSQGELFLKAWPGGLFKYDPESDEIERLYAGSSRTGGYFAAGGSVVYSEYYGLRGLDFRIQTIDFGEAESRILLDSMNPQSPLHGHMIVNYYDGSLLLSPDGEKLAFATIEMKKNWREEYPCLWTMNRDGTGLIRHTVKFPPTRLFRLLAWPSGGRFLFVSYVPSNRLSANIVVRVDLEAGGFENVVESLNDVIRQIWTSPDQKSIACIVRRREDRTRDFIMLNLETLARFALPDFPAFSTKWSPDSKRIAGGREHLTCYSWDGDKLTEEHSISDVPYQGFHWLPGGGMACVQKQDEQDFLLVLDRQFTEKKRIALPFAKKDWYSVWGLEDRVIVGVSKNRGFDLWRVNLDSGDWKQVY